MKTKLNKIFKTSKRISIYDNSKIVIMSDCHRGGGNASDNFLKNKSIFLEALDYYYNQGFTYIELGDGDEMWEVKNCKKIVQSYIDIFRQLKKFYDNNRLIMIYGNHDIDKKKQREIEKCFYKYYDDTTKKEEILLNGIVAYESLVINYKGIDIFLIHGHQASFLNNNILPITKFFVRYFWKIAEYCGIKDPTGIVKKYEVRSRVEKKLEQWSRKNNIILITGHTHKPVFPELSSSLYVNDGSCIHPDGITAIEIENGKILLVKWEYNKEAENILIERRVLGNRQMINNILEN